MHKALNKNDILTIPELSEYLKIPKSTLYYLTANKKIPASKVGRHWRFRKKTIEKWMEAQEKIK